MESFRSHLPIAYGRFVTWFPESKFFLSVEHEEFTKILTMNKSGDCVINLPC